MTGILISVCVLAVLLQLTPAVDVFSGVTFFKVVTLEAKRVHLEVRTPILLLPALVGVVKCLYSYWGWRLRT